MPNKIRTKKDEKTGKWRAQYLRWGLLWWDLRGYPDGRKVLYDTELAATRDIITVMESRGVPVPMSLVMTVRAMERELEAANG